MGNFKQLPCVDGCSTDTTGITPSSEYCPSIRIACTGQYGYGYGPDDAKDPAATVELAGCGDQDSVFIYPKPGAGHTVEVLDSEGNVLGYSNNFSECYCACEPTPATTITITNTVDGVPIAAVNINGTVTNINQLLASITDTLTSGVPIGTFSNGNGGTVTLYAPTPPTPTSVIVNGQTDGNPIATVNVNSVPVDIEESITTLDSVSYNALTGVLTVTYTNELGVPSSKSVTIQGQATAFFNGTNPATATAFSLETPPVVDNPALRNNPDYVLVGSDGSSWYWNGTAYVTAPVAPETTEWYTVGSTLDAKSNKTTTIYRKAGIAVGAKLDASTSNQFNNVQYAGYDDFGVSKQHFLFRDWRFPATQPAGFSLSNGGGGGDYYPVFGANPRGGTTSFLVGTGLAPADDAAGNKNPALVFRINRTGTNASPTVNRSLFAIQNYTSTKMLMDVDGRVCIGDNYPFTPSAQLELNSVTKGFLPSRMTTTQILAIVSPANGLMVYNTTLNKLCVYELNAWKQVTTTAM